MNNNNIEDFFNQSMEQFNNAPPDLVWDNIENKLDNNTPFYKNKIFWIFNILGIIFISSFIYYAYQSEQKINNLIQENKKLGEENSEIKEHLKNYLFRAIEAERILEFHLNEDNFSEKNNDGNSKQKTIKKESIDEYNEFKKDFNQPQLESLPIVLPQVIDSEIDTQIIINDGVILQEETKKEIKIFSIIDENGNEKKIEVEGVEPNLVPPFIPKTKEWLDNVKEKFKKKRNRKNK